MKKVLLLIIMCVFSISEVGATPDPYSESTRFSAELIRCDSTENIWLKENNQIKRIRLVAYDAESGPIDREINEFVCSTLESSTIELEYVSSEVDEYNRIPAFVFVNGELLQNILIKKGYGQVNNVTAKYKYLDQLCDTQVTAISANLGIWQYPNIQEKYCNSGIKLAKSAASPSEKQKTTNKKDLKHLKYMIFMNSGIVLLLLIIKTK